MPPITFTEGIQLKRIDVNANFLVGTTVQWQITNVGGSTFRFTRLSGVTLGLEKVVEGDIANIFGLNFNVNNRGAFVITGVENGISGIANFEISNEFGVVETVLQTEVDDLAFFRPTKATILSNQRYATVFEVAPNVIEVFLPATTKVTERQLAGAAHIHEDSNDTSFNGPYIYDPTKGGRITEISTTLQSTVTAGRTARVIDVDDSTQFPDEEGYLVFGFGTAREELPVKYIGRPGSQLLLIDPAHVFRFDHIANEDITLLSSREPVVPEINGSDFAFYLTGTAQGRIFAEELIARLAATGLTLIKTVIYPGDVGLGNAGLPAEGTKISDKVYIWGGDDE